MVSFWEKQSFLNYDYIIIGSGIVGLSTAISLKEKNQNFSVLILERGLFPTGASTKNAGFACFGSFTELIADIKSMGEDAALEIVKDRWEGLSMLRTRLGDSTIQYESLGGYELLAEDDLDALKNLPEINSLLIPIFKQNVFTEKKELIQKFGFSKSSVKSIVYNPLEGQLDTGKLIKGLIKKAQSLHIDILTGAEVTSICPSSKSVDIEVDNKFLNKITFKALGVAVCTNAFTKNLLPDLEISPGRGMILVTKPIQELPFKGAFHFQEGFYYFRNYENRILFGGGRNLDFEKETSTDFQINDKILASLQHFLKETILPGKDYEIDQVWTGIMAFGKTKKPFVDNVYDNVVAGVGLGGMGVAIGSLVGEKLANLLLNKIE